MTPASADGEHPGAPRAGPTIWFDLTTSAKLAGIPPVGITRVERHYAASLRDRMQGRARFCRFDPAIGRFCRLDDRTVERLIEARRSDGVGAADRRESGMLRQLGRAFERALRRWRRNLTGKLAGVLPPLARAYGEVTFHPGDLLVLAGETWEHHDLAQLAALRRRGMSILVLLYDLVPVRFPHFYRKQAVDRFERFLEIVSREASLVLCISEATRADFADYARSRDWPMPEARVVPLGHDLAPPSASRPGGLPPDVEPGRYVLYVGTIQVRKNHQLLYSIWRRLAEERGGAIPWLVFAGSPGFLVDDLVHLIRSDPLTADRIAILSGAGDAELSWLYRNCLFTVYPSLYEGWGLPISESLALGKACLASTTTSMPEAGQGLAIHIDPLDGMTWYREIEALIDHPERLAQLEAAIRARYRPLDWHVAGAAFRRELERLAAGT